MTGGMAEQPADDFVPAAPLADLRRIELLLTSVALAAGRTRRLAPVTLPTSSPTGLAGIHKCRSERASGRERNASTRDRLSRLRTATHREERTDFASFRRMTDSITPSPTHRACCPQRWPKWALALSRKPTCSKRSADRFRSTAQSSPKPSLVRATAKRNTSNHVGNISTCPLAMRQSWSVISHATSHSRVGYWSVAQQPTRLLRSRSRSAGCG